jgi:hypothetical protein
VIRPSRFLIVFVLALAALLTVHVSVAGAQSASLSSQLTTPIAVYGHDSTYGQAFASTPVDEKQALRDLDELQRLKSAGVRTDYDMMDLSWFKPGGAYRNLHSAAWPNGPDAWIAKCRAIGIRPGLRINGNMVPMQTSSASISLQWKDSLSEDGRGFSLFEGGFLSDLMASLQSWYDHGVRLFEFGSVNLSAATPASAASLSPAEIASRNEAALRRALQAFRDRNRDAVVLVSTEPGLHLHAPTQAAVNPDVHIPGLSSRAVSTPFGAVTLVSTGALAPSSTPQPNLWRSIDIESDTTVRRLEQSGLRLAQIDSAGFTVRENGSGLHAWKGSYLLSMARGGWMNSTHGDLSLIQDDDARWMARVQRLFLNLQQQGSIHSFGGSPSSGQAYGFAGATKRGSVYVIVNPGQTLAKLTLPSLEPRRFDGHSGRVQFQDAGFAPRLNGNTIILGPGQMAVVGYGVFARKSYNFGVQNDVIIPHSVELVYADFHSTDTGAIEGSIDPPMTGVVRLVVYPRAGDDQPSADLNSGAAGENAGQSFSLVATQSGRPIPVRLDDGSKLGGSLGWAVGEIDVNDLTPGVPLVVKLHSNDNDMASLEASAYAVEY